MIDTTVTILLTFAETGGVVQNRDHSTKLKFEASAEQFAQAMRLSAFPDFAVIEATFVLKEVAGRPVRGRRQKGKVDGAD